MQIFYKLIILFIMLALGWLLPSLIINLLLKANMLGAEFSSDNLKSMVEKIALIWIGTGALGIISLFIKQKWRYILLLSPLLAPSAFVIIFALNQ